MAKLPMTTVERALAHTHRAAEVRDHGRLVGLVEQARPKTWFHASARRPGRGPPPPRLEDLGKFRTLEEAITAIQAPTP